MKFEDDIKIVETMDLPKQVKDDFIDCTEKKIIYRNDPTLDNLSDVKFSFHNAHCTLKSFLYSDDISPDVYETLFSMMKKLDEY